MENLRFPVGRFSMPNEITAEHLKEWIGIIKDFPTLLKAEIEKLKPSQLEAAYRPDGWTVRQVVHHCADSHMNSFIRFKLALTEDSPTVKTYEEGLWADMVDVLNSPLEPSIKILEGVHLRWVLLLKSMSEADFEKTFFHPEKKKTVSLYETTALYSWHSMHHLGHVKLVNEGK